MPSKASLSFLNAPQEAFKFYQEQGYFIEENVFSAEECAHLIAESMELENYKNGTFRPEMMPHRQNKNYLNAMKNPIILKILSQLIAGKVLGLQSEFFYCKPGTRGFSLHQDNFFVQAPLGAFASAWIALTDTHPQKGGLIVYPGSHLEGELPVRKKQITPDSAQDPNANNEETLVPEKYRPLHVSVPQGAALFIHGHLVHGSNPNLSTEWRHVLLNTYIREGEKFRAGNYANREVIEL